MPKSGIPGPTTMNAFARAGAEKDLVKKKKRVDTINAETDRMNKNLADKATRRGTPSNAPMATPTKGMKMLPLKKGK